MLSSNLAACGFEPETFQTLCFLNHGSCLFCVVLVLTSAQACVSICSQQAAAGLHQGWREL